MGCGGLGGWAFPGKAGRWWVRVGPGTSQPLGATGQPARRRGSQVLRKPCACRRQPGERAATREQSPSSSLSLQSPLLTKLQCQLAKQEIFKSPRVHFYRAI